MGGMSAHVAQNSYSGLWRRSDISENGNLNAKITSARAEALGLLAGMHFAQKWKGRVEWKIDNTSVISTQAKLSWLPAREWMQQSNRDVYGNMAWIQPQLLGTWDISHRKSHVEDRKQNRNDWSFSEWGSFHADALCDIIMKHRKTPPPLPPGNLSR
jgi:hypothetical protein